MTRTVGFWCHKLACLVAHPELSFSDDRTGGFWNRHFYITRTVGFWCHKLFFVQCILIRKAVTKKTVKLGKKTKRWKESTQFDIVNFHKTSRIVWERNLYRNIFFNFFKWSICTSIKHLKSITQSRVYLYHKSFILIPRDS